MTIIRFSSGRRSNVSGVAKESSKTPTDEPGSTGTTPASFSTFTTAFAPRDDFSMLLCPWDDEPHGAGSYPVMRGGLILVLKI